MSFIIEDVGADLEGPELRQLPERAADLEPLLDRRRSASPGRRRSSSLLTVPVLLGLLWLVQRTKQGKAMRATAQDMDASAIMGINVNRTISFTFLIAGGARRRRRPRLRALAETTVRYDQGFTLGLIAFTAAVLGGIGNLPGAVLGALLIGLIQAFNEGAHLARARARTGPSRSSSRS